jgi:hypothetical protein
MSTPETQVKAKTVRISGERYVVLVPSARVTVSGDTAEVMGYLNVVMVSRNESAVHYYVLAIEDWNVSMDAKKVEQTVERVLMKANEVAEKYAEALSTVLSLGVEISFRGNLASRKELPEWLQKHLPT